MKGPRQVVKAPVCFAPEPPTDTDQERLATLLVLLLLARGDEAARLARAIAQLLIPSTMIGEKAIRYAVYQVAREAARDELTATFGKAALSGGTRSARGARVVGRG